MAAQKSPLSAQTLVAQQATIKLNKTISDLNTTISNLATGATAAAELTDTIAQKEAELSALEVQFSEAKRQRQVEFDLALKEDQLSQIANVLSGQNKVVVSTEEFNKLKSDYATLQSQFNESLSKEVQAAKQAAEASKAIALRQKELEIAATNAVDKAAINSLSEKNTLLTKQVTDLQAMIAADRDARVKESVARGNPVVTVQSGK